MTIWISERDPDQMRADLAAVHPSLPLAGRTLAVKDNIDVLGFPTTAGCPAYAYDPRRSAPVIDRLLDAGIVVAGKTNLDQFATGLVGMRSPYGIVRNPLAPDHVAGGSSSGSAVAVATGLVDLALGTDTAGSGRIPAAFCGVVGLKPTRGWLSMRGVVPACRSLDCVSVFAADVAAAAAAVEVAAGYDVDDPWSRPEPAGPSDPVRRIGVPSTDVLAEWCEPQVLDAFTRLVRAVDVDLDVDVELVEVDLAAYLEAGDLLYGGAFVAERYAAVGAFVHSHPGEVDATVGSIISASGFLSAHALAADIDRLAGLRRRAEAIWRDVDAVVVPTAPFHPLLRDVAEDPVGVNSALGRFTNGCNLLDWCAAAVPVGSRADGLPFGVSVLGPAWTDRSVWAAAAAIAGQSAPTALGTEAPVTATAATNGSGATNGAEGVHGVNGSPRLAVAGAHLEGQPLNHQLTSRGARLVCRTETAPTYRMVALDTSPPKPGVIRVPEGGASLEVEVWELDDAGFGSFVAEVPAPLAIGTVELVSGELVSGFVVEGHAVDGATDITAYGGWRAWLSS